MRQRRRFLARLGGLCLAPLAASLAACGGPSVPLRLSSHPWPGYEPLFLARELGPWPENVELIDVATASDSLHALAAGTVDGATLTLDEVLRARAEGIPLTVVAVLNISSGADMLIAKPAIRTLADLRGHAVGVEHTAVGALLLAGALAAAGLKDTEITTLHLPPPAQENAWHTGRIDALVTYEPVAGRLERAGGQRLFDSREMPDMIVDVLAVNRAFATRHAAAVRAAVAAHFTGLAHLRGNALDAHHRMARRLRVTAAEVPAAFRGLQLPDLRENQRLLGGGQAPLLDTARQLAATLRVAGILPPDAPDDFSGLLTADYLPRPAIAAG
jgi:NitT/TauT family transport system substrate-binding protein